MHAAQKRTPKRHSLDELTSRYDRSLGFVIPSLTFLHQFATTDYRIALMDYIDSVIDDVDWATWKVVDLVMYDQDQYDNAVDDPPGRTPENQFPEIEQYWYITEAPKWYAYSDRGIEYDLLRLTPSSVDEYLERRGE